MKVWIEKPISEPPEKKGYYPVLNDGVRVSEIYWTGKEWRYYKNVSENYNIINANRYTHYLVPAEGHFLTNEELEEVKGKVAELAWDILTNSWGISKTEYLKSIK